MSEKSIINDVLLEFTKRGDRLFRQNTGLGWAGKFFKSPMQTTVTLRPQDVLIRDARPLHAGLCKGSSDLIGWTKVTITPEMVGQTIAQFTAYEVKYGKTATTEDQTNFIEQVKKSGGKAKIIHSLEEIINL